jgi:hypothetical protein
MANNLISSSYDPDMPGEEDDTQDVDTGAPGPTAPSGGGFDWKKFGGAFGGGIGDLMGLLSPSDDGWGNLAGGMQSIIPTIQQYGKQAMGYMSPYEKTGRSALDAYFSQLQEASNPQQFISNILSKYQESPGLKFQKQQGMDALNTSAAARGLLGSGAQAKSLMKYSQGLASQGEEQYLRDVLGLRGSTLSGLSGLSGMGEQAAGTMGQFSMGTGQNIANLMSQIAQAKAEAKSAKSAHEKSSFGSLIADIGTLAML